MASYFKYDHKINLLEKYKDLDYSSFCGILQAQLEFVKLFLKKNLKKRFIETSNLPYLFPILLTCKLGSGIRFCIDY